MTWSPSRSRSTRRQPAPVARLSGTGRGGAAAPGERPVARCVAVGQRRGAAARALAPPERQALDGSNSLATGGARINAFLRESRPHATPDGYFGRMFVHGDITEAVVSAARLAREHGIPLAEVKHFLDFVYTTTLADDAPGRMRAEAWLSMTRWLKSERQPDGTRKRVHSAEYGCEKRWQVRWRDEQGRQRKQSFAKKAEAEAFDAKIRSQLADGTYVDPSAAWSPSASTPRNGAAAGSTTWRPRRGSNRRSGTTSTPTPARPGRRRPALPR